MKFATAATIVALLILGGASAGYYGGITNQRTVTSISTTTLPTVYTTTTTATSITTLFTTAVTTTSTVTSTVSLGPPYPTTSLETANVAVGSDPRTIAVDENLQRIYIAYWFSDVLTVVSGQTHTVVATIPLPAASNNGIAADYQSHMVYVSVDGGVVEINGTTDQVVGELHHDLGYGSFSYDQATHILYGIENGSLVGVNVRTGSIVANVSLSHGSDSVAVDPSTNMIVTAGCDISGLVCNSMAFIVNGSSRSLVATVRLGSASYPRVAVNTVNHLFYVSGDTLAALNETTGKVVFNVNPQECGPFDSMAFEPSDRLAAISLDYNYTFIYDGATGALLDMYSLPSIPQFVAYNGLTNELYVTLSSRLVAFHDAAGPGYVNTALVGSGRNCPVP